MTSEERVVLLDEEHRPAGTMAKADVHGADTPLHLAFSVYVFDRAGRFLVTRRALSKRTWAGVWSNTCCGHPAPGEPVESAARRRLAEELSLPVHTLEVALPDFSYRAVSPEGLVEHEVCPVLVATADEDPRPDPDEVVEWRWVDWSAFRATATSTPWLLSPWSVLQTAQLPADLDQSPAVRGS
ncbi:MAG TPA: isopentenyl-diphosphate Delta-isomerase [Actinomycetales bacterium]|nr:isopentenyl-diphosphate Delta-isomerase [Actinomycetales bacterium]